jgi:hypothetical protein
MVKGCAILLLWITIGTSVQAQDCFYSQRTLFRDGTILDDVKRYDCKTPPKTIIIEKEIPAKNRSFGEFLFGVEEEGNGITHLFSSLVSMGVL